MTIKEYFISVHPDIESLLLQYIYTDTATRKSLQDYRPLSDLLAYTVDCIDFKTKKPTIYCTRPAPKQFTPLLQLGQVVELAKPRIGIVIPSLDDLWHLQIMIETGLVIDTNMYDSKLKHNTHGVHDIMKIWNYDTSKGLSLLCITKQKPSWERK